MSTYSEERTIVRGRPARSGDRLPENNTGLETQPSKFSSGMWAVLFFVASEAMFFAALFTTYFYLRARLPEWQPLIGEKPSWHGDLPFGLGLPTYNTIILVASSVTMQLALMAIQKDNRAAFKMWLTATVVMGAIFLLGQGYEYWEFFTHGFVPPDNIFAAVFYTLTGFHGAHVTGGVVFIAICLYRAMKGHFSSRRHLAVEAASIYWHFVDVVWIGLFFTIYVVG